MTTLTPREGLTILAVNVSHDIKNPTVIESHSYFHSPRLEHSIGGIDLPRGFKYTILLDTKTASEEQAAEVVENDDGWYPDFKDNKGMFVNATDSLKSLLRAHNLKGRYIFLKQEKL